MRKKKFIILLTRRVYCLNSCCGISLFNRPSSVLFERSKRKNKYIVNLSHDKRRACRLSDVNTVIEDENENVYMTHRYESNEVVQIM